tara:strand:- start:55 stop:489 length:435 start_codon:yes stop_codon:yes gene_type:complete
MPYKDKEKKKLMDKKYREANKEKIKEQQKEYYIENKQKLKEYQKEYNIKNEDKIKDYRKSPNRNKTEKISEWTTKFKIKFADRNEAEFYYETYINTHRCTWCDKMFKDSKDRCMDHCHTCGLPRAIICKSCNNKDLVPCVNCLL